MLKCEFFFNESSSTFKYTITSAGTATFNHFHRAPSFNPSRLVFYYISTHFSGHLSNAPSVLRFCAFNMPVLNGHFVCYIVCHIIDGMGPRIERSQNKSQALTADNWQIIELEIWFLLKKNNWFQHMFCVFMYQFVYLFHCKVWKWPVLRWKA